MKNRHIHGSLYAIYGNLTHFWTISHAEKPAKCCFRPKEASNCNVIVGQNNMVYVQNDNIENIFKVQSAIKLIESEANSSGLTEKIKEMLTK